MSTPPESRHVRARGLDLHFLDWGNEGAQPLLLLHGLQDSAALWTPIAEQLRDEYHVIALDHRGHGDSPWAETYALEDYVGETGEVIEALDLENVIVMGHSAGGKNAFIHACRRPERLARLVIVDMDPDAVNPGSANMFVRYRSESDDYETFEAVVERIRDRQPRSSQEFLEHSARALIKERFGGGYTWKRDRTLVLKYERPDAWEYLPRIITPTVIIRGADSPLLTGPVAHRMQAVIPGCTLIEIPDAGHWVHLEQPEAFIQALRSSL